MTAETNGLPLELRPLFGDVDFNSLNWGAHCPLIIQRILETGNWQAIRWLRSAVGDETLRHFLIPRQGKGLSPRQ